MQEAGDSGSPVTWGEHVTDEEYSGLMSADPVMRRSPDGFLGISTWPNRSPFGCAPR
jgi:hypothetical protein